MKTMLITQTIRSVSNNYMQYTKKKPKVYKLEANATGMNMVKNPQNFS